MWKKSPSVIVEVLAAAGVRHFVCSPGSRNVPLLIALDNRPDIIKHVVVDERSAAFAALGLAETSGQPVALVCTSGSALLNYGPAVAEAFYKKIPLFILSADRPSEWIDQDDSQVIRQFEALRNIVKNSYDIPEDNGKSVYPVYVNRIVNDAVTVALSLPRGPVHINVQFDNPLSLPAPHECPCPRKIETLAPTPLLDHRHVAELAGSLQGKKILLVCGFMQPDHRLNRAVASLMTLPQVAVMAETISNLHLPPEAYDVDSVLCTLSEEEKQDLRPDVVITLGGALVSRHAKEYIRSLSHCQHWSVGFSHTTVDCFFALTKRIEVAPAPFIAYLARFLSRQDKDSSYAEEWKDAKLRARKIHREYLDTVPWSDLFVFRYVLEALPPDFNLHLSNGTPIRYAQLFTDRIPHASFCNRGVSGIDGCTSTAIGSSWAYKRPTLLISGDTSFIYDISALNLPHITPNFKVIVINNGGGGIFHFISTTASLPLKHRYLTEILGDSKCPSLAQTFGFRYFRAEDESQLSSCLPLFLSETSLPALLEIVTDGSLSASLLRGYFHPEN